MVWLNYSGNLATLSMRLRFESWHSSTQKYGSTDSEGPDRRPHRLTRRQTLIQVRISRGISSDKTNLNVTDIQCMPVLMGFANEFLWLKVCRTTNDPFFAMCTFCPWLPNFASNRSRNQEWYYGCHVGLLSFRGL